MTRTPSVIFGVVKGRNGKPVSGARVSFITGPVPLPDIAALTDAKGAFALSTPVLGEYVIEVVSEEFAAKRVSVAVKGKDEHIEVRLS